MKITILLITLFFLLAVFASGQWCGDVNDDAVIDIADMTAINDYINGTYSIPFID